MLFRLGANFAHLVCQWRNGKPLYRVSLCFSTPALLKSRLSACRTTLDVRPIARLNLRVGPPHIQDMKQRRFLPRLGGAEAVRLTQLAVGWLLIALAPVVGVLPGPGGVLVFAAGLALVLRGSLWAKRRYVAFKRRFPRIGRLGDRGLLRGVRPKAPDSAGD